MVGERYALGQIQADPLNDADRFAVGGCRDRNPVQLGFDDRRGQVDTEDLEVVGQPAPGRHHPVHGKALWRQRAEQRKVKAGDIGHEGILVQDGAFSEASDRRRRVRDHRRIRPQQPRMRVRKRVQHPLGEKVARDQFRDQDVGALREIVPDAELAGRLVDHPYVLLEMVCRNDPFGGLRNHRYLFAAVDVGGAGARRHHRQQAAAGSDIEHAGLPAFLLQREADRPLERIVSPGIVQHPRVPERNHRRQQPPKLMPGVMIAGIDSQHPAKHDHREMGPAGFRERDRQIGQNQLVVGNDFARGFEASRGLRGLAEPIERHALLDPGVGLARIALKKFVQVSKDVCFGLGAQRVCPEGAPTTVRRDSKKGTRMKFRVPDTGRKEIRATPTLVTYPWTDSGGGVECARCCIPLPPRPAQSHPHAASHSRQSPCRRRRPRRSAR